MRELTAVELERQDYVDNEVYRLIVALGPEKASIPWNIEMIGAIRDELRTWIVERLRLCSEEEFYPYVGD
jgi:hypothetical protein